LQWEVGEGSWIALGVAPVRCHQMRIHIIRLLQWEVGEGRWIALGVARQNSVVYFLNTQWWLWPGMLQPRGILPELAWVL